jgi:hypothetical protein
MKKADLLLVSLFLSVSILPSVARADLVSPGEAAALLLIIIAPIIGIIALLAWLMIRKIKKDYDSESSERKPEIRP